MKFDCTHGKKAKYLVSLYGDTVEDKWYCSSYWEAKKIFDKVKLMYQPSGTILSLADMVKDVRKEFKRF